MTGRTKTIGQVVAIAAVVGLLALLVWKLAFGSGQGAAGSLAKGENPFAPTFTLSRLDAAGGDLTFASLKGKPVVVNFWASWCEGCMKEARALSSFARRHPKVALLGVD